MPFTPKNWFDESESLATPITAAALEDLETRVTDYTDSEIAGAPGGASMTSVYDVQADYGAIGDGTTDDTDAIQAAIDQAKSQGGVVYLPIGIYRITDTLELGDVTTGVDQVRPFSFRGAGKGQTTSTGRGSVIRYDPPTPAGAAPAIRLASAASVDVSFLAFEYVTGFDRDLIDVEGNSQTGDAIEIHIHHCSSVVASGARTARSIVRFWKAIICWVDHCHFSDADNCIRLHDNSYCVGINISHCTFNGSTDAHILLGPVDGENIVIEKCIFEAGTSTTGIRGGSVAGGEAAQSQLYSPVIKECWFGDAGASTTWIKNLRVIRGSGVIQSNFLASAGSAGIFFDLDFGAFTLIGNGCSGAGGGTDSLFGDATDLELVMIGNASTNVESAWSVTPGVGYTALGNTGIWPADSIAATRATLSIGTDNSPTALNPSAAGTLLIGDSTVSSPLTMPANTCAVYTEDGDNLVLQAEGSNSGLVRLVAGTTPAVKLQVNNNGVGFNGATPSKPTGVGVDAASIHAALVTLGLITA